MGEDSGQEWRPPYLSYDTLVNFIEKKLAAAPLPPKIDRSYLDSMSGSVQAQIFGVLKMIGFLDAENRTQDLLSAALKSPDDRRAIFQQWATTYYAKQVELASANATAGMLAESFGPSKYTGSTLRKAIVFYLALSEDVGLPRSPHFRAPKQPTGTAGKVRPGRRATSGTSTGATGESRTDEPTANPGVQGNSGGERKAVHFGPAGTVTVDVQVKWLDLPDPIFLGLRKVVKDLEDLEALVKAAGGGEPEADDA